MDYCKLSIERLQYLHHPLLLQVGPQVRVHRFACVDVGRIVKVGSCASKDQGHCARMREILGDFLLRFFPKNRLFV